MKTLIRGGMIVTDAASFTGDILIENGAVLKVAERIDAPDAAVVDAAGKLVLPGAVDPEFTAVKDTAGSV